MGGLAPIPLLGGRLVADAQVPRSGAGLLIAAAWLLWLGDCVHHISIGAPWDTLWLCNVTLLVVSLALTLRSPALGSVAFIWAMYGTPLWALDLATGGEVLVMGIISHIGGFSLSAWAAHSLGLQRGSWIRAGLAGMALQLLCRFATPPEANVNLVHSVWAGWEGVFASHWLYLGLVALGGFAVAWLVESLATRVMPGPVERMDEEHEAA